MTVSNLTALRQALKALVPGMSIILEDGDYDTGSLNFNGLRGTESEPISIEARNIGKSRLKGGDNGRLKIKNSSHITFSGLEFQEIGLVILDSDSIRVSRSSFENAIDSLHWIDFKGSTNGRVDHCDFGRRETKGAYVSVRRPSRHLRIDHNYFHDRPCLNRNGAETISLHGSHGHRWDTLAIVEHNLFERCDGENELICVKSHQNVFRYNTFVDCVGYLSIRGGDYNKVYDNYFFNFKEVSRTEMPGAVRTQGLFNKVANNYMFGMNACVLAVYGDDVVPYISPEDRESWWTEHTDDDSYSQGIHEVAYRAAQGTTVAHNTIIKCKNLFHWTFKGFKDELPPQKAPFAFDRKPEYPPSDWAVANNLAVNIQTFVRESCSRARGKEPDPGFEEGFQWVGNVLSGQEVAFGEGRNLEDHEFSICDVRIRELKDKGLFQVLNPVEATPDYPRKPGIFETHDLAKLFPSHLHVGCNIRNSPLTSKDVGILADMESET